MRNVFFVVIPGADNWFVADSEHRWEGPYKRYEALGIAAAKAVRAVESGDATAEVMLEHPDGRRTTLLKHQPQTRPVLKIE